MSPYDPKDARYPTLEDPIPIRQLQVELARILHHAGIDPGEARIEFLDRLDAIHRRNPRRYAQVVTEDLLFEFSRAILWLPDPQRIGVLAHEVGHVLDPEGGEDDADRAALHVLNIQIVYDLRWPGKGLQTAYI